ncbi:MAG TPA: triphosphoribosyl-dephospho-CoA synthase, partial [Pseudomonas sp.]
MNAQIAVRPRLSLAEQLADLAVETLIDEVELSPKPALVDRRGSGAHSDLSLELMHASAWSLWATFHDMAAAGQAAGQVDVALRETLGRLGRDGEAQMLAVTGGVNTHRGAI